MTGTGLIFRDPWVNHMMKLIFSAGPELDPRPTLLHGQDFHSAGHRAASGCPCWWLSPGCPVCLCRGSVHRLAPSALAVARMWPRRQGQGLSSCSLMPPLAPPWALLGCAAGAPRWKRRVPALYKRPWGRVVGHLAWESGLSQPCALSRMMFLGNDVLTANSRHQLDPKSHTASERATEDSRCI